MQVRVPSTFRPALHWLATLDSADADAMIKTLEETSEFSRQSILKSVENNIDQPIVNVEKLFDASIGLLRTLHDSGEIRNDDSTAKMIAEDASLKVDADESVALRERLKRLLSAPSLNRVAKALDLQADHPNVYRVSRIFSEFRPLFDDESLLPTKTVALTHTLKIEFYDSSLEVDSIYMSMDSEDLLKLQRVVNREVQKLKNLDVMLNKSSYTRVALIQEET